ncbi:hypothetical protein I79_020731 [Cricetulus griseus]|uniref:Uncharacterized protein n=1 Tax=Cricetulus griseus TaxID=10029 RepID=G3IAV0_CRIGR|nr:hypothetical protein I79_020731 [Cricetulus griseus]
MRWWTLFLQCLVKLAGISMCSSYKYLPQISTLRRNRALCLGFSCLFLNIQNFSLADLVLVKEDDY